MRNINHQAAETAHQALRAGQAQRAVLNSAGQAIDAALRPCFDRGPSTYPGLSGDLRRPYDADLGAYNAHPADPRTPDDSQAGDMLEQISCAERALSAARDALDGLIGKTDTRAARRHMDEARGFLAVPR